MVNGGNNTHNIIKKRNRENQSCEADDYYNLTMSIGEVGIGGVGIWYGVKGLSQENSYVSKGSTGRMEADNLKEQIVMKLVKENPDTGKDLGIYLKDPRWSGSKGWVKMEQSFTTTDSGKITVHYLYNKNTGILDDFKFKSK